MFFLKRKILLHVLVNLNNEQRHYHILKSNQKVQSVYLLARSMALHEANHLNSLTNRLKQIGETRG